jgi:hypothetical protein
MLQSNNATHYGDRASALVHLVVVTIILPFKETSHKSQIALEPFANNTMKLLHSALISIGVANVSTTGQVKGSTIVQKFCL